MRVRTLAVAVVVSWATLALPGAWAGPSGEGDGYQAVTQVEVVGNRQAFQGKKVRITGSFLFTGSDFCYQIRKTKINTRDYFCFALGTPSLVRLYLKKSDPQADRLLNLRKGQRVTAYGTFDFLGKGYNFMVVDRIEVEDGG